MYEGVWGTVDISSGQTKWSDSQPSNSTISV